MIGAAAERATGSRSATDFDFCRGLGYFGSRAFLNQAMWLCNAFFKAFARRE
jgi:hypothetical protein